MSISEKVARNIKARKKDWEKDFWECVKDIAEHPVVLQMKMYQHHGSTTCYQHCLNVAYYNYLWCKAMHLDARAAARAGMVHDLFLYDWHTHKKETGDRFHGMTHPKAALENAVKFFELDRKERDIVISHMWPVTPLCFPRTREGWVTTFTDKYCGMLETSIRR